MTAYSFAFTALASQLNSSSIVSTIPALYFSIRARLFEIETLFTFVIRLGGSVFLSVYSTSVDVEEGASGWASISGSVGTA